MRARIPALIERTGKFSEYLDRIARAIVIAAPIFCVTPAFASEPIGDDPFSLDAAVHIQLAVNDTNGLAALTSADLDAVRGEGLSPEGFSGLGDGQQIGVILWDELKRNKLAQPDGGSAPASNLPSDVTVQITAY